MGTGLRQRPVLLCHTVSKRKQKSSRLGPFLSDFLNNHWRQTAGCSLWVITTPGFFRGQVFPVLQGSLLLVIYLWVSRTRKSSGVPALLSIRWLSSSAEPTIPFAHFALLPKCLASEKIKQSRSMFTHLTSGYLVSFYYVVGTIMGHCGERAEWEQSQASVPCCLLVEQSERKTWQQEQYQGRHRAQERLLEVCRTFYQGVYPWHGPEGWERAGSAFVMVWIWYIPHSPMYLNTWSPAVEASLGSGRVFWK